MWVVWTVLPSSISPSLRETAPEGDGDGCCIALAVGAGGSCLDIFTLLKLFSPLPPSLGGREKLDLD